jgi:hypothetical protein
LTSRLQNLDNNFLSIFHRVKNAPLISLYTLLNQMEEILEFAITFYREALTLCPPGHPGHPGSLHKLASAVSVRFEQMGKKEDLEEVIELHCEALFLCTPGHPLCSACLNTLGNDVHTRFNHFGMMGDLEEAITIHREALTLRLLVIPIVLYLSTISRMLFPLALISWERWRTWRKASHSAMKLSPFVYLVIQIVPNLSTTSLALFPLALSSREG